MSAPAGGVAGSALKLERRSDGVGAIVIDVPNESVNTLQQNFEHEFDHVFDQIEQDSAIQAVIIVSNKSDSFIAGADIKLLRAVTTAQEAIELSLRGHRLLGRLETLRLPVVAAIHGACLGGGLELALACHGRIASDHPKTKLGLPEVQLGVLPGLGGTQRLPRLIGVQPALDLLLTGKQLDARRALRVGLVDEVVPAAILREVAASRALSLVAEKSNERRRPLSNLRHWFGGHDLSELALAENPIGRRVLFGEARKKLLKKTRGNYPAPEQILDVVKVGLESSLARGLEAEAEAFGQLLVSEEAQQLMGIFFATNELKKDTGVDDPTVVPRRVEKVGILGGGLMGAGIAYVSAAVAKLPVRIKDRDAQSLQKGLTYVAQLLDERVQRRRMKRQERDVVMARVSPTTDYSGFARAQVVVEAVFEDLELKQQMVRDIEESGHREAIFASNTSSLPISKIASAARHPERVVGMHYFSPVHKMPLLEIIVTSRTAAWVTATCVALGKQQGKTVIVVNDGVGFYTSRILSPYMSEASHMLSEGVDIAKIDNALIDFGFPVGPMTLLDEVGIDVAQKVGKIMHDAFGDRMKPPEGMEKLVADQRLGRKNLRGLYRYDASDKDPRPVDEAVYELLLVKPTLEKTANEIAQRCVLSMVNEAVHCFAEGILRSARDGDVGAIFGLGFPPFLGGPFRYADKLGAQELVLRLRHYERQFGSRFAPAPLLLQMVEHKQSFHGKKRVEPAKPS